MLPPLSRAEQRHTAALAALIRAQLAAAGGWLSFERFMELALYAPRLGYYSAGGVKIGSGGDFVTAPEASALFSRCIARQCAQILHATGGEILELGAGTGSLAAAVLAELAALDLLPERYAILEISPDLAQRQRERLSQLPPALRTRVAWLERLPERALRGVIIANEVADALPCRRVRWTDEGLMELGVASDGGAGAFREQPVPADAALTEACAQIRRALPAPLPAGYTSEVCLRLDSWIASLGASLTRGVLLLCDYGLARRHYYHPQRVDGTLRCHFKQRAHDDPYINVGVQDITAWVDFTRMAEAAAAAGLTVSGFATQAGFLLGLGIEGLVAASRTEVERVRLAGEARRLMMPEEMGESFKAMALGRNFNGPLAGFAVQDLRHLL
jgi:SAM-dependent MidA family methyltransferase